MSVYSVPTYTKYVTVYVYCSGALLTVGGDCARKGHTKSASISAAATRHAELTPLDTNIDAALRARSVGSYLSINIFVSIFHICFI